MSLQFVPVRRVFIVPVNKRIELLSGFDLFRKIINNGFICKHFSCNH
nr:MAG TPA: hypothetical protein [Caudoviricetes sp.]